MRKKSRFPITRPRSHALTIPEDAAGSEIHIILEVRDRSEIVPLYDYRRIVMAVAQGA